jgi:hypothetical protein
LTTKTASGSALRLTASDVQAWEKSISGNTGIPFDVGGGGGTKLSPAEIHRAPDRECGLQLARKAKAKQVLWIAVRTKVIVMMLLE